MSYLPPLPEGYTYSLAKRQNILLAYRPTGPILYYDQVAKAWRELDRHISEVHPAREPSKS